MCTYGDSDLAHAVTSIGDGSTFTSNDDGNMTRRNLAGQTAQIRVWDEGRRLAEVRESGSVVAEFLYAIDDTRVRRKVDDTYTFYHSDGTEYSFDAATGEGYFTYYHQMSGRMIGFTRSDTDVTTWTGTDIVGSTSATRDESGQVATHRYTPFGETRTDGNLDTDHLFTGQILDESSGLAFYNARYYDPTIGRFITPDSIVPNPLNGQDYNRYTYVRNNPVKYNDPTGNCPTLCTAQDRADVNEVLARGAATVAQRNSPIVSQTGRHVVGVAESARSSTGTVRSVGTVSPSISVDAASSYVYSAPNTSVSTVVPSVGSTISPAPRTTVGLCGGGSVAFFVGAGGDFCINHDGTVSAGVDLHLGYVLEFGVSPAVEYGNVEDGSLDVCGQVFVMVDGEGCISRGVGSPEGSVSGSGGRPGIGASVSVGGIFRTQAPEAIQVAPGPLIGDEADPLTTGTPSPRVA